MKNIYIDYIARAIGVKDWQVENCVHLFEEGNTIPFISRYRKEKTGGLDDVAVAEIKHWNGVHGDGEEEGGHTVHDLRAGKAYGRVALQD